MVLVAQLAVSALLLLSSIVLARQWGSHSYGLLTTLFNVTTFCVGVTDCGIGVTLVRLVGKYRSEEPARSAHLLMMTLVLEVLIGVSLILGGIVIAPNLSELLFHSPAYVGLVRVSLITAGIVSTSAWVSAVLQAHQRFNWLAVWSFVPIGLRVVGLLGATFCCRSITAVVWAYLAAALCSTAIGVATAARVFCELGALRYRAKKAAGREFFGFMKWVAATVVLGTVANRFDVFLLASRSDPTQVGVYAVGAQLAALAPLVVSTLNTTLMPRVTKLRSHAEYRSYFRQASALSMTASACLLVLLVLGPFAIQVLYGSTFLPAVPVLRLLLLGYILTILAWPYMLLAYQVDRPDIFTKVNIFQVVVQLSGNVILIPVLGATAPALMFLIITVLGLSIMAVWIGVIHNRSAIVQV